MYITTFFALYGTNGIHLFDGGNIHCKPGYRKADRYTSSPAAHIYCRCPEYPIKTPKKNK
jgi:hypothetical protein